MSRRGRAAPSCTGSACPERSPADNLEAVLAELRRRVRAHPLVEEAPGLPRVRVVGFGAAGTTIEIEVFARIRTVVAAEFLEAQEDLLLEMMRSVEACRVAAPVPEPAGCLRGETAAATA